MGDTQGNWDGVRIQQVLRNLLSNAIKYGLPAAPIRVVLTGEHADVLFEVKNSGPTIEAVVVEQKGESLNRGPAHEDADDRDEGLGLGLYIVREIVLAHGGEVTVRSDSGETSFAVRLPRGADDLSP